VPPPARPRAELWAAGVRLAIVSNAASHSERLLDRFGFRDRVGATAMSWSVGVLKPDPLIYRAALDALGVVPGEAAYVGDGGDGELGGARRLGLLFDCNTCCKLACAQINRNTYYKLQVRTLSSGHY
jgi:FMN phosphatase YigB (HAD superfamily)